MKREGESGEGREREEEMNEWTMTKVNRFVEYLLTMW